MGIKAPDPGRKKASGTEGPVVFVTTDSSSLKATPSQPSPKTSEWLGEKSPRRQRTASPSRPAPLLCPYREGERGQDSLLCGGGMGRTLRRPRGRRVDASPKRLAIDFTQRASPSGLPRRRQRRTASNSCSPSGSFTRATQFASRAIGQEDKSGGGGWPASYRNGIESTSRL